ncbi:MAG: transposase, partial [Polaribacter sp.]
TIDATLGDQEISYPTDAELLNTARKESERIIDLLYKQSTLNKPRDYRRVARTAYLVFSKKRKKSRKEVRKFIGKQLRYLKRNIAFIEELLENIKTQKTQESFSGMFAEMKNLYPDKFPLPKRAQKIYWVIQNLYDQQKEMYDQKNHSVKDRIVNIYQPYVRPIPRGKDKSRTEFGAKISASVVHGMTRVEHISWNPFNESTDLKLQAEMFKTTYGHYPKLVLADRVYLNLENKKWLKENNIRTVGKPLGRPPKERLSAYKKRKLKEERNQRNHIEGKFGQAKKGYGLSNIQAKTSDTSQSWIGAIFFVINLIKLQKIAKQYAIFCAFFKNKVWDLFFTEKNRNSKSFFIFTNKNCQNLKLKTL